MKTRASPLLIIISLAFVAAPGAGATDYAGTYFGTFQNTPGEWAMYVVGGGRLPTFIAYIPGHDAVFENYPYGGDFYEDGRLVDNSYDYTLNGQIANGSFHGTLSGVSIATKTGYSADFSGTQDLGTGGPAWRFEGYTALRGKSVFPNQTTPKAEASVIVGPSGKFMITAWVYSAMVDFNPASWPREWQAGASGQLDSSGRGHFTSAEGMQGEITFEESGRVHAMVTPPGSNTLIELEGYFDRLVNLSTRGHVGDDENVLISGFVIAGSGTKRMLIRAVGPELSNYNVAGILSDPRIDLTRMSDHTVIASSDNWGASGDSSELVNAMANAGAFALPVGSKDAAMLVDLPAGSYTAVTSGTGGVQGVALGEVYSMDDDQNRRARLVNISTRGFVGTGDQLLIPGFVSTGNKWSLLVIRAVGPSLADHGVANPLSDPVLTIYDQTTGQVVATNDDWESDTDTLAGTFALIGAFSLRQGSHDAALYFQGRPNTAYTVVVSGKNGATGVALAEIYDLGSHL